MFSTADNAVLGTSYADYKFYFRIYVGVYKGSQSVSTNSLTDGSFSPSSILSDIKNRFNITLDNVKDFTNILQDYIESIKVTYEKTKPAECDITFSYSSEDLKDPVKRVKTLLMLKILNSNYSKKYRFVVEAGMRLPEFDIGSASSNYSIKVYDLVEYKKKLSLRASSQSVMQQSNVNSGDTVEDALKKILSVYTDIADESYLIRDTEAVSLNVNNSAVLFVGSFVYPNFSGGSDGIIKGTIRCESVLTLASAENPLIDNQVVVNPNGVPSVVNLNPAAYLAQNANFTKDLDKISIKEVLDALFGLTAEMVGGTFNEVSFNVNSSNYGTRFSLTVDDLKNILTNVPVPGSNSSKPGRLDAKKSTLKYFFDSVKKSGLYFNTSALKNYPFSSLFSTDALAQPVTVGARLPNIRQFNDFTKAIYTSLLKPKTDLRAYIYEICFILGIDYTIVPYLDTTDYSSPESRFGANLDKDYLLIGGESTVVFHLKNMPILYGFSGSNSLGKKPKTPAISLRYGEEVLDFRYSVKPVKVDVNKATTNEGGKQTNSLVIGTIVDGKWKVTFEIDEKKIKEVAAKTLALYDNNIMAAMDYFIELARENVDAFLSIFTTIPFNNVKNVKAEPVAGKPSPIDLDLDLRNPIPALTTSSVIFFENATADLPLVPEFVEGAYSVNKITHTLKAKDEIWKMELNCTR